MKVTGQVWRSFPPLVHSSVRDVCLCCGVGGDVRVLYHRPWVYVFLSQSVFTGTERGRVTFGTSLLYPADAPYRDINRIVELRSVRLSPTHAATDARLSKYACIFVKKYVHFVQSVLVRINAAWVFIHIRTWHIFTETNAPYVSLEWNVCKCVSCL